MKFALTDKDGTRTVHTLKSFKDLTLADYGKFHNEPWPEDIVERFDHCVEYISRTTGAPKKKLRKLPIAKVEELANHAEKAMDGIRKAEQKPVGHSFTFKRETYFIPGNLEALPWEYWHTMVNVLWPNCEKEVDTYATSLAVFCLKEGEDLDDVDIEARKSLFMGLPCSVALGTCAFFFNRSQRYRDAISPHLSRITRSRLHSVAPMWTSSLETTAQPST